MGEVWEWESCTPEFGAVSVTASPGASSSREAPVDATVCIASASVVASSQAANALL